MPNMLRDLFFGKIDKIDIHCANASQAKELLFATGKGSRYLPRRGPETLARRSYLRKVRCQAPSTRQPWAHDHNSPNQDRATRDDNRLHRRSAVQRQRRPAGLPSQSRQSRRYSRTGSVVFLGERRVTFVRCRIGTDRIASCWRPRKFNRASTGKKHFGA